MTVIRSPLSGCLSWCVESALFLVLGKLGNGCRKVTGNQEDGIGTGVGMNVCEECSAELARFGDV